MLGSRLNSFAQAGIEQKEGNCPALAEQALKQAGSTGDVHLPTVSSSTGAAVTAVIRCR